MKRVQRCWRNALEGPLASERGEGPARSVALQERPSGPWPAAPARCTAIRATSPDALPTAAAAGAGGGGAAAEPASSKLLLVEASSPAPHSARRNRTKAAAPVNLRGHRTGLTSVASTSAF